MSETGIEFIKKKYEEYKNIDHPASKYLKKILDDPFNKTNVLKNGILAHCMECSYDPEDKNSHPKNCKVNDCPFYLYRPMSVSQKSELKTQKRNISDETKEKLKSNLEKARMGRKLKFTEALEIIKECGNKCKCKEKKEKNCKCKEKY